MSIYKRGNVWWVKFQWRGEIIRRSSRTGNRRVAEKHERSMREERAKLDRGGKPRRVFDDAMARFVAEHLPTLRKQAARRYVTSITALRPHLEGLYLDQITPSRLADFVTARRREVSSATVRRDLACLSSMFSCAISWEWADRNPARDLDKRGIREAPPRTRYLSHDEEGLLLTHAGAYLVPMIKFAIDTGLRLEEQLSLTWDQIDMRRGEVFIEGTKTGTARTVPLLPRTKATIQAIPPFLTAPWVFHKSDGARYHKLTRGLAGAVRRSGIEPIRWHDLRRTCGCRLLQDHGLSIYKVARWLGHASVAVTERSYAFLGRDDLHEAVRQGTSDE